MVSEESGETDHHDPLAQTRDELMVPPPPGGGEPSDPPDSPGATMGGRLHPAVIGVGALGQLVPLVLVVLAGPVGLPFLAGVGLIGLGVAVANWYRFTWRVDDGTLIIEQGLLERRRRVIPLGRIQSVETVRKLRHRLFGVVALRVESVGGEDSEGKLDALDPQLAEQLRAVLLRTSPATTSTAEVFGSEDEALVRLSLRRLIVAGLTGGRVGVVAAMLGFAQELWFGRLVDLDLFDSRFIDAPTDYPVQIVAIVLVAFGLVFLISVGATALIFWNFTLWRSGDNLHVRRGLLEQRSDTIPLRRLQAVRLEQNIVRRALGLAAIKVEIAGRAGSSNGQRQTDVILPIGRLDEAMRLADQVLAEEVTATPLQPMPSAARWRRVFRAVLVALIAFLPAVVDPWGFAGGLVIIPLVMFAFADYRALGWAATTHHVLARSGVFVRRLWVVPNAAVQSLETSSTPFQRRRKLATLKLEIARSGNAGDPSLVDLGEDRAAELAARLADASTDAGRSQVRERRLRLSARLST